MVKLGKTRLYLLLGWVALTSGCSALGTALASKVAGSASNGIEATAQVGQENTKAAVNAKQDNSVRTDDVAGDVNAQTYINLPWWALMITMVSCVILGLFTEISDRTLTLFRRGKKNE